MRGREGVRKMRRWRDQHGLSLVEAIAGVAILAVVLTPLLGLFTTARYAANGTGMRTQALTVARDVMSEALQDYDALSAGTTTDTSGEFSWRQEVTEEWKMWKIVVTVEWQERGAVRRAQVSSAIADRRRAGE